MGHDIAPIEVSVHRTTACPAATATADAPDARRDARPPQNESISWSLVRWGLSVGPTFNLERLADPFVVERCPDV